MVGKLRGGRRWRGERRGERGGLTFGGVGGLVLAEPGEVFVLDPGHVVFAVLVVLFLCPVRHLCDSRDWICRWVVLVRSSDGKSVEMCRFQIL